MHFEMQYLCPDNVFIILLVNSELVNLRHLCASLLTPLLISKASTEGLSVALSFALFP